MNAAISFEEIPEIYRDWVAHDHHEATRLTEPTFVDTRAQADLARYYPVNVTTHPYRMKHRLFSDAPGVHYVKVVEITKNWGPKFTRLMQALRFEAVVDSAGKIEYLLDSEEKPDPGLIMNGWMVTRWQVIKIVNSDGRKLHQDIITWKKGDTEVLSSLGWHPYAERVIQAMDQRVVSLI